MASWSLSFAYEPALVIWVYMGTASSRNYSRQSEIDHPCSCSPPASFDWRCATSSSSSAPSTWSLAAKNVDLPPSTIVGQSWHPWASWTSSTLVACNSNHNWSSSHSTSVVSSRNPFGVSSWWMESDPHPIVAYLWHNRDHNREQNSTACKWQHCTSLITKFKCNFLLYLWYVCWWNSWYFAERLV